MNKQYVGDGKVVLIAGGGKIYTDIAARFCRSEKSLDEIIASPYDKKIVKNIINSGHNAALEFDYFVFGVEGYSRVTEIQLVRKRIASYLIKSGRVDKQSKRSFDVVIPKCIEEHSTEFMCKATNGRLICINLNSDLLLEMIETWYNSGVEKGFPEEDLRYLKPQATEFKGIIGMNCHSLLDWFKIRCCMNAQTEIRDLANKMRVLCKQAAPDLFENAGANCKVLGYCPENKLQHKSCKGKVLPKNEALEVLNNYQNNKNKKQFLNEYSTQWKA